jgi:hypothetical protein
MPSDRQGATAPMEKRDGIETRSQLIGMGTVLLILVDRSEDVITAGITTTAVMVNAGIAPQHAWTQPILRLVDTSIGLGVRDCGRVDRIKTRISIPRAQPGGRALVLKTAGLAIDSESLHAIGEMVLLRSAPWEMTKSSKCRYFTVAC